MIVLAKLNLHIIAVVCTAAVLLSISGFINQTNWITVGMKTPICVGEREQKPILKKQHNKFRLKGTRESEGTELIDKREFLVVFIKVPEIFDELILGRKRIGLIGGKRDTRYWQYPVYNETPMVCRTDSDLYKQLKGCPLLITKY